MRNLILIRRDSEADYRGIPFHPGGKRNQDGFWIRTQKPEHIRSMMLDMIEKDEYIRSCSAFTRTTYIQ